MLQRLPLAPSVMPVLVVLTLAAGAAAAAPASSEELNAAAAAQPGQATLPATPLVIGSSVSQSKTVELLLQLQDQPQEAKPATDSSRRPPPVATRIPAGTAAVVEDVNPLLALKATLLGAPAPRETNQDVRQADAPDSTPHNATLAHRSGSPTSGGGDTEPRQSLLSNPVVRFLREHRALILTASIGILAALWFTATFSMRRGR